MSMDTVRWNCGRRRPLADASRGSPGCRYPAGAGSHLARQLGEAQACGTAAAPRGGEV